MKRGGEKYNEFKFLGVDTLEEAMQEVADLANYAHFTWIKLYLLKQSLPHIVSKHPAMDADGFVPTRNLMGAQND